MSNRLAYFLIMTHARLKAPGDNAKNMAANRAMGREVCTSRAAERRTRLLIRADPPKRVSSATWKCVRNFNSPITIRCLKAG